MSLFKNLLSRFTNQKPSDADWEGLEQELLKSDLGRKLTRRLIEAGKSSNQLPSIALKEVINDLLSKQSIESRQTRSGIILVVGVNGTGKTTSVAKLAKIISGKNIMAAADTFRAAAVEQLQTWGSRIGVPVITGKSDPASVVFDAVREYLAGSFDNLIIDTAGRLHNKADLMDELGKIKRVIEKSAKVSEVLLVMDATTGQNGLIQAQTFTSSVEVTGIILTKMDGSARGGIALTIEDELGIPIKWVGTGESIEDFAPFDVNSYVASLFA